jgi:hypothetical protein
MASPITVRLLTLNNTATDATTHALPSATPTSGAVLTASVVNVIGSGTPTVPTAAGTNGLSGTWTQIATVTQDLIRTTTFRSVAASGVAGVLTFSFGGTTQSAFVAELHQWDGVTSDLIVQSKTAVVNGGTSGNFDGDPLAALSNPMNAVFFCMGATGSFIVPRMNNTQGTLAMLPAVAGTNTECSGLSAFTSSATLSPAFAVGGAGSDIAAIAMEIAWDGDLSIPTGSYELSGTIRRGGSPQSGATVRVFDRVRGFTSSTTTDGSGLWSVSVDVNTADQFSAWVEYETGGTKYRTLAPWAITAVTP